MDRPLSDPDMLFFYGNNSEASTCVRKNPIIPAVVYYQSVSVCVLAVCVVCVSCIFSKVYTLSKSQKHSNKSLFSTFRSQLLYAVCPAVTVSGVAFLCPFALSVVGLLCAFAQVIKSNKFNRVE